MSGTIERVAVGIDLGVGCCPEFAGPLFLQLRAGYEEVSLMPIPRDVAEWRAGRRTARKRADRCERRGYRFERIERHLYVDDIYEINTSASHRQGRPMSSSYVARPKFPPLPAYECRRHAVRTYGVLHGPELVAYLWLYRCGDLALVSSILGHADCLDDEVMWLLWQGMVAWESAIDPQGFIVYNRHDSGTDGLRFWKEHVGLEPVEVAWLP